MHYLHDVSANERDGNHEQPTWNNSESPEDIAKRNCEPKFGKLSIEWVEVAFIRGLLLPCLKSMKIGEGLHIGGGSVEGNKADVHWSRLGRNLHDPQMRRTSPPGVAQDRLIVAVEVCQMRGSWIDSEQERALVESLLNFSATAKACLVASSDQNPPLFWG